jgi:hypothetical protein
VNVEKLRELQKFIQIEPRRFTMKEGLRKFDPILYSSQEGFVKALRLLEMPPCQTAACLAGEAVLMENPEAKARESNWYDVYMKALSILDLTNDEGDRLFYFNHTPRFSLGDGQFAARYEAAETPKERVQVAVDFIDHFIKTETAKETAKVQ